MGKIFIKKNKLAQRKAQPALRFHLIHIPQTRQSTSLQTIHFPINLLQKLRKH